MSWHLHGPVREPAPGGVERAVTLAVARQTGGRPPRVTICFLKCLTRVLRWPVGQVVTVWIGDGDDAGEIIVRPGAGGGRGWKLVDHRGALRLSLARWAAIAHAPPHAATACAWRREGDGVAITLPEWLREDLVP